MLKNIVLHSLFIVILLAATDPPPSPFTCIPSKDCVDAAVGDKVPNPKDCESYYVCIQSGSEIKPSDVIIPCPDNQYFDQYTADCAEETTLGQCDNICHYTPIECNSICTTYTFETVAYVGNCSKYYVCTPSGAIEASCASPHLYYNGSQCVEDKAECCDFCTSYCVASSTEIPDAYDCTKFYFCTQEGPVSNAIHGQCPSGEYFDTQLTTCVIGDTCTSICSNSTAANIAKGSIPQSGHNGF